MTRDKKVNWIFYKPDEVATMWHPLRRTLVFSFPPCPLQETRQKFLSPCWHPRQQSHKSYDYNLFSRCGSYRINWSKKHCIISFKLYRMGTVVRITKNSSKEAAKKMLEAFQKTAMEE